MYYATSNRGRLTDYVGPLKPDASNAHKQFCWWTFFRDHSFISIFKHHDLEIHSTWLTCRYLCKHLKNIWLKVYMYDIFEAGLLHIFMWFYIAHIELAAWYHILEMKWSQGLYRSFIGQIHDKKSKKPVSPVKVFIEWRLYW